MAYSGGADPKPDVDAIVAGIRDLVQNAEQIAEREAARDAVEKAAAEQGAPDGPDEPAASAEDDDAPAQTGEGELEA